MKKIKIKFVDFQKDLNDNNDFLTILSKRYDVEISDNPEYLFYSVFGLEHLKYKNCVRIYFTGECLVPDFNECDYAMGFDRLVFGDRYLRLPLFQVFKYRKFYEMLKDRKVFNREDLARKTDFCNYVVSNSFVKDKRTEIFLELCKYKKVNSGGRYMNNIGGAVKDKFAFQQKHKFSIAFENASYDGYATEKIVEAFAAGTIPIYWGDPRIAEDFNEKAFVNCHNYKSWGDVVKRVKEIDENDDLYLQMMNEPILKIQDAGLDSFLYNIFDQSYEESFRRSCSRWAIAKEEQLLRHKFFEEKIYSKYKRIKNMIYRLRNDNVHTNNKTK